MGRRHFLDPEVFHISDEVKGNFSSVVPLRYDLPVNILVGYLFFSGPWVFPHASPSK